MTDWKALAASGELRGLSATEAKFAHEAQDKPTDWMRVMERRGKWRLVRINQCDGCAAGTPITDGVHAGGGMLMFCQANRYSGGEPRDE